MKLFDASPLIAILGNLNNPGLLLGLVSLGYTLYVPSRVVDEVSKDPEKSNLQAMIGKNEVNRLDSLDVQSIEQFQNRYPQLGKGESEVIIWAKQWQQENKQYCCMIDDAIARKTAEKLGLKCKGTVGMLCKLKETGIIDEAKFSTFCKKLQDCGFRYNFKSVADN